MLNLAVCHEGEGKLATAWTEFNSALSEAIKDGRKGREQLARQHIAALEPKLSHLMVVVPAASQVDGLTVVIDGTELRKAGWGISAAVDPGSHRVEAAAPGRRAWSAIVVVGPSGDAQTLEVPPLASDAPSVPSAPSCPPGFTWGGASCVGPEVAPPPPAGPVDVPPMRVASSSPLRYAVGALSLAAFGTSLVTGILAWSDHTVVGDHCDVDRQYCDGQSAIDARSAERTWAWISTISLGVGALGAGAFVFWPRETRAPSVTIRPTAGGGTIVVGGLL